MAPRHRLYTPEIADEVLERLADGEGLIAICRRDGMPSDGAVRHWVDTDHEGFAARYARAREIGVQRLADEILELSDETSRDVKVLEDGREVVDYEVVARSKLRVDSRKWLLSKLLPKTYGDRVALDHSGEMTLKGMPDDKVESRLTDLIRKAGIAGAAGGKGAPEGEAQD